MLEKSTTIGAQSEESNQETEDDEISVIPKQKQINNLQTSLNAKFNWEGIFYVKPTNICMAAYVKAEAKKKRFGIEYNRFNNSIWKHLEINLQVKCSFFLIYY